MVGHAPSLSTHTPQSRRGVEQGFRPLQVGRIEAFGEPDIDSGQQFAGLDALTLLLPQPAQAHRGIVDLARSEQVAAIDVPGEPHGLALSPDGKAAYVVQRKLNQLAIIDTASRQITKIAPEGKRPDMIVVSPDGKTLYVTSRDENKLLVVSAADLKVTAQMDTGEEPHGVALRK